MSVGISKASVVEVRPQDSLSTARSAALSTVEPAGSYGDVFVLAAPRRSGTVGGDEVPTLTVRGGAPKRDAAAVPAAPKAAPGIRRSFLPASKAASEVRRCHAATGKRVTKLCGSSSSPATVVLCDGGELVWPEEPEGRSESKGDGAGSGGGGASGAHPLSASHKAQTEVSNLAAEMLVRDVAPGAKHALMVSDDGSVFAWGANSDAQLGLGHRDFATEPELVMKLQDKSIAHVAAGGKHSAVLTADGGVYTFGRGREGQTGLGFKSEKARKRAAAYSLVAIVPQYVGSLLSRKITLLSAGCDFTTAVSENGDVYSWGDGTCGQLGVGRVTKRDYPQMVLGPRDGGTDPFVEVAAGWAHTLARTSSGRVWAWGLNARGQLGIGNTDTQYTPVQVKRNDSRSSDESKSEGKAASTEAPKWPPEFEEGKSVDVGDEGDVAPLVARAMARAQHRAMCIARTVELRREGLEKPADDMDAVGDVQLPLQGIVARVTRHEVPAAEDDDPDDVESEDGEQVFEIPVYPARIPLALDEFPADPYNEDFHDAEDAIVGLECRLPDLVRRGAYSVSISLAVVGEPQQAPLDILGSVGLQVHDPVTFHTISPSMAPTSGGVRLEISGDGLFGAMLTDPNAATVANELLEVVDDAIEEHAVEQDRAMEHGNTIAPLSLDCSREAPDSEAMVRLTFVENGVAQEPVYVRARYVGRYRTLTAADKVDRTREGDLANKVISALGGVFDSKLVEEEEEEEVGEFSATLVVDLEPFERTTSQWGALWFWSDMKVLVDVSTTGVSYSRVPHAVTLYEVEWTGVSPCCGEPGSTSPLTIEGTGLVQSDRAVVRFRSLARDSQAWEVPATASIDGVACTPPPELDTAALGGADSTEFALEVALDGHLFVDVVASDGAPVVYTVYRGGFMSVEPTTLIAGKRTKLIVQPGEIGAGSPPPSRPITGTAALVFEGEGNVDAPAVEPAEPAADSSAVEAPVEVPVEPAATPVNWLFDSDDIVVKVELDGGACYTSSGCLGTDNDTIVCNVSVPTSVFSAQAPLADDSDAHSGGKDADAEEAEGVTAPPVNETILASASIAMDGKTFHKVPGTIVVVNPACVRLDGISAPATKKKGKKGMTAEGPSAASGGSTVTLTGVGWQLFAGMGETDVLVRFTTVDAGLDTEDKAAEGKDADTTAAVARGADITVKCSRAGIVHDPDSATCSLDVQVPEDARLTELVDVFVSLNGDHEVDTKIQLTIDQPADAPANTGSLAAVPDDPDDVPATSGDVEESKGADQDDGAASDSKHDEAKTSHVIAVEKHAITVDRSFAFLDPPPPQIPEDTPEPSPTWDPTTGELIATSVSCGAHHSAAVSPAGELFTWGCSTSGCLGLDLDQVSYTKGDQVSGLAQRHVKYPGRVRRLAHRHVSMVKCAKDSTISFAPAVLQCVGPERVSSMGGDRVVLVGPGLVGLVLGFGQDPVADDRTDVISSRMGTPQ